MIMQQLDVGGVPALFVRHDGPTIAGLTFRVGQADETLPYHGITRLLAHLASHDGGSVGAIATTFRFQGPEDDAAAFLDGVCAALSDPPTQRLEAARSALHHTAAAEQAPPRRRHGARDYGLVGYPDLGLDRVDADDLRDWARTWFTRQNAVLWVAGERLPAALRLPLPDGTRRPVPAASSVLPSTPAFFLGHAGRVAFDGLLRRRAAGPVLAGVLERELLRNLRETDHTVAAVGTSYEPRGDGLATVTAFAEALPGRQDAALGGFVDVLAALGAGRVEQADVDAARAEAADSRTAAGMLPGQALDLLTGAPVHGLDEIRTQLRGVTVADVREAALEVLGSGLLEVPAGQTGDWAGYATAPATSAWVVTGQRIESLGSGGPAPLVVGADGVSFDRPGGHTTVMFAECAACLAYADGGRQLVGFDGITVRIEPTLHPVPPELLARVDAAVAPVTVPMPARDPSSIPRPGDDEGRRPSSARKVGAVTALLLGLVALCCGGVWTWLVADNSDPELDVPLDPTTATLIVASYAGAVALVGLGLFLLRKRKIP